MSPPGPAAPEGRVTRSLLGDGPLAGTVFVGLGFLQRYHVDTINAAKTAATSQRRIEKAISLFRDGRQR